MANIFDVVETQPILKKAIQAHTASKYLNELEKLGIVQSVKIKNSKFFVNVELFERLKIGVLI